MRQASSVVVLVLLFASGCEDDAPLSPLPPESGFYPLAVGNKWSYTWTGTLRKVSDGDTTEVSSGQLLAERELVRTEELNGLQYIVELNRIIDARGPDTTAVWERYLRQDEAGLYSIIPPDTMQAHTTAAAGPIAGEFTVLAYPLQPGTKWTNGDPPQITTWTVEARDDLDLPVGLVEAYRTRVDAAGNPATDFRFDWDGPCGRLRTVIHEEVTAIDPLTQEMTLLITDEERVLDEIDLKDTAGCVVAER